MFGRANAAAALLGIDLGKLRSEQHDLRHIINPDQHRDFGV
jgi:hypothetical protein